MRAAGFTRSRVRTRPEAHDVAAALLRSVADPLPSADRQWHRRRGDAGEAEEPVPAVRLGDAVEHAAVSRPPPRRPGGERGLLPAPFPRSGRRPLPAPEPRDHRRHVRRPRPRADPPTLPAGGRARSGPCRRPAPDGPRDPAETDRASHSHRRAGSIRPARDARDREARGAGDLVPRQSAARARGEERRHPGHRKDHRGKALGGRRNAQSRRALSRRRLPPAPPGRPLRRVHAVPDRLPQATLMEPHHSRFDAPPAGARHRLHPRGMGNRGRHPRPRRRAVRLGPPGRLASVTREPGASPCRGSLGRLAAVVPSIEPLRRRELPHAGHDLGLRPPVRRVPLGRNAGPGRRCPPGNGLQVREGLSRLRVDAPQRRDDADPRPCPRPGRAQDAPGCSRHADAHHLAHRPSGGLLVSPS